MSDVKKKKTIYKKTDPSTQEESLVTAFTSFVCFLAFFMSILIKVPRAEWKRSFTEEQIEIQQN